MITLTKRSTTLQPLQHISIVYPYKRGAAEGDELRYSLRSLFTNMQADVTVYIVGHDMSDKPTWMVESSRCRFITVPRKNDKEVDTLAVFRWACKTIKDRFIVCHDDVYFTSPIFPSEFENRHFVTVYDSRPPMDAPSHWRRLKKQAVLRAEMLFKCKYPIYDYGTHCPYVVNSVKGGEVANKLNSATIFETIYQNVDPLNSSRYIADLGFLRVGAKYKSAISASELTRYKIVNHVHGSFRHVRDALKLMFPTPGPCEKTVTVISKPVSPHIMAITTCDAEYEQTYPGIMECVNINRSRWARITNNQYYVGVREAGDGQTGHWTKIHEIRDRVINKTDPSVDWYLWLDADIIITHLGWLPNPMWLQPDISLIVQAEKQARYCVNTGVFLVRNNEKSVELFDKLLLRTELYAKKYHEQEALKDIINRDANLRKRIMLLPWATKLQSGYVDCSGAPAWATGDFCRHYMRKEAKKSLLVDFKQEVGL